MKGYAFWSKSRIGIEIAAHAIRFAQLQAKTDRIEQLAMAPLPANTVVNGNIVNWEALIVTLKEWVSTLGLKGKRVVTCLPANFVTIRPLSLPAGLSNIAIEAEIYAQIQTDFPGLNEALTIDYGETSGDLATLFFALTRKAYVDHYLHAFTAAGLTLKILDVDDHAAHRALGADLSATSPSLIKAAIHRKPPFLSLLIFNKKTLLLNRCWHESANWFTQLQTHLQHFFIMYPQHTIQQWIGCGDITVTQMTLLTSLSLEMYDPFIHFKMNPVVAKDHGESKAAFAVALGCAIREIPKW